MQIPKFLWRPVGWAVRKLLWRAIDENPGSALFWLGFLTSGIGATVWTAAELSLADHLDEGPLSCDELAERSGTDPDWLRRILRALMSLGLFAQEADGRYCLTPMARLLQQQNPAGLYEWIVLSGRMGPAVFRHLPEAVRQGTSPFVLAHGTTCWDYFLQHPDEGELFDRAMSKATQQQIDAILATYDFSPFETVVDVACGRGSLLMAVLQRYPHLQGTFLDRPQVIATIQRQLSGSALAGRAQVIGGSILEEIPSGADLYLLKHVLHDWDDESGRTILTNIRRALPPHGRLLLIEGLMSDRPGRHDLFMKWWDIQQMVSTLGQSRTLAEFDNLFHQAGLRRVQAIPSSVIDVTLLEVVPAESAERPANEQAGERHGANGKPSQRQVQRLNS